MIYQVAVADLVRSRDGRSVQPRQRSLVVDEDAYVVRIDGAVAYVHTPRPRSDPGWTELAPGAQWAALAAPVKAKLLRSKVYRRKDRKPLPTTPDRATALANARALLATEEVDRIAVYKDDVLAGDLEEVTDLPPHEWM